MTWFDRALWLVSVPLHLAWAVVMFSIAVDCWVRGELPRAVPSLVLIWVAVHGVLVWFVSAATQ